MSKFAHGNQRGTKVSNEQVFEMRRLSDEGWTQPQLARHFGLHINTIGRIVRGESRQSVPMVMREEDHAALQARIIQVQADLGQGIVDKLVSDVQKSVDTSPTKQLEELVNWPAAEQYGVKPKNA